MCKPFVCYLCCFRQNTKKEKVKRLANSDFGMFFIQQSDCTNSTLGIKNISPNLKRILKGSVGSGRVWSTKYEMVLCLRFNGMYNWPTVADCRIFLSKGPSREHNINRGDNYLLYILGYKSPVLVRHMNLTSHLFKHL